MGVLDKFRDLVGIGDEFDEDYDEDERITQIERQKVEPRSSYSKPKEKVVPMQKTSVTPFKMVVTEPEGFEQCPKLVDSLKQRKPIIINLEKIDSESARKIFDFLSGATYALNGNVQKIANNIFVFAPDNVDINATAESRGFDFRNSGDDWR